MSPQYHPAMWDSDFRKILRQADDAVERWSGARYHYDIDNAFSNNIAYFNALIRITRKLDPYLATALQRVALDYKLILTSMLADSVNHSFYITDSSNFYDMTEDHHA